MRGYETVPERLQLGESDPSVGNDRWLDIVALGTSHDIERVQEVQFDNARLQDAIISNDVLKGHGVLRFVMENERSADGILSAFPPITKSAAQAATIVKHEKKEPSEITNPDEKDQVIQHQEELISALRQEIARNHQVVDELRQSESVSIGYHNVAEDSLFPFLSVVFILLLAIVIMKRPEMLTNNNNNGKKMHRV
jgi:hypothetical protein